MKNLIPAHNLVIVSIKESVSNGTDIYNASRYAWRLNVDRARQADYVLAHQSGEVVGVFEVDEWLNATDDAFKGMGDADDSRWAFKGRVAPSEVLMQYFGKQLPEGFIKRGTPNPVRFIFLDDTEKTMDDPDGLNASSDEVEKKSGRDSEEKNSVSFDMAMIIDEINVELSRIISESADELNSSEQTKVRPGYGPNKFYLDKIDGEYDSSLQSLIHYILWQKRLYHKFLTERQLADVERVIKEDPDCIYRPDLDDESTSDEEFQQDEALEELFDILYWQVITHVGVKLSEFNFFDNSKFEDNGYVESDD